MTPPLDQLIRTVRNKRVILDADLAAIYGVPTKALNQAVRRNPGRFPEDFAFQLTREEFDSLRSQTVTLKKTGRGQHRKYLLDSVSRKADFMRGSRGARPPSGAPPRALAGQFEKSGLGPLEYLHVGCEAHPKAPEAGALPGTVRYRATVQKSKRRQTLD